MGFEGEVMTTAEILQHFQGARRNGNGWMAQCPAHEDRNPSLSIHEREGKILLKCFAGCSAEAVVSALGLQLSDLFVEGNGNEESRGTVEAVYRYHDESSNVLFEVVRYQPKAFRQCRPNGTGGSVWNLDGVRRVLYRFPEVLKSKSVLVVEGEKDVDTAHRELGLVATCNPGGAGKWRPEYSQFLIGKRVCVVADADPPGLAHARDVAKSLVGHAESVRLIEALPQSKDLTEWVEQGGLRERLLQIIAETPDLTAADVARWQPPKSASVSIPGVLASDVAPEGVCWLWENRIPFRKVTLFDGDPDEGKSLVTVDLAARITQAWRMPDDTEPGCPPAGAVLVSLEDGPGDTIRPRLEAAGADLCKVRLVTTIKGEDGIEQTPTIPDHLSQIEAAIQNVGARLVVIDPLVATLGAETNSYRDQDVRRALAPLAALAERTGVAVICIRHLNKSGGQNPKYRGGGTIGIIGAARAAFLFGDAPGHDGVHVMAPVKGNLWRRKPAALEYSIEDRDGQPVIAWRGASVHTAKSLLAQPEGAEESNALTDARNFLTEFLKDGPRQADAVFREARRAKVSERTLYRAKAALGILSQKEGIGEGQHWVWSLPNTAKGSSKIANNGILAAFEQSAETKPINSTESPKIAKFRDLAAFGGDDGNLRSEPDAIEL
jgi:hypothetical protein